MLQQSSRLKFGDFLNLSLKILCYFREKNFYLLILHPFYLNLAGFRKFFKAGKSIFSTIVNSSLHV